MGSEHPQTQQELHEQQFCLRWSNHQSNMLSVFDDLLQHETLVDVTIACDGVSIKAHKVVLSACSPYFQHLFQENPCKHPIVILKDTTYTELRALVDFMYKGEVNVTQEQLSTLLKTAETLKIKGLAEVSGNMNGQPQQHLPPHQMDGAGGGDRLTPPPPLERPQQQQQQQLHHHHHRRHQQRSYVEDGRTTSSPLPPPPQLLPPSAPLQPPPPPPPSLAKTSPPPQPMALRPMLSKGVTGSLSITIPPLSTESLATARTSPGSPPTKRKKMRQGKRSLDVVEPTPAALQPVPAADDCRIEMHGSPEMIEAKVEVTSPDEADYDESGGGGGSAGIGITRRRRRSRRVVSGTATRTSSEYDHHHLLRASRRTEQRLQHHHDDDDDEQNVEGESSGRQQKPSTPSEQQQQRHHAESNRESLDDPYAGVGEEGHLSIGEQQSTRCSTSPLHQMPKSKSPVPSTSGVDTSGGDRGSSGHVPKRGQPRILNEAEEVLIVTYIMDMAAKGRPVTRRCVLEFGNTLLRREDRIPTGSIHCNPEKGLSNDWWKEFKKRHPGLPVRAPTTSSSTTPQLLALSLSSAAAAATAMSSGIGIGGDWSRMVEDSESDCPKDL